MKRCPHCGKPMRGTRFGVYLTERKLLLFDLIHRRPGQPAQSLASTLSTTETNIRTTVCQINDLFSGTNLRIIGSKSGKGQSGYKVAF